MKKSLLKRMDKSFYVIRNKDAAAEYIDALLSAGYYEQNRIWHADFLLIECEHGGTTRDRIFEIARVKPVFKYPHTPYSYWINDGPYPAAPVKCNFVVGQGAVMGMAAYGYPYRVEPVGWTGCPIKEFTPTKGTKLLFVPPHLVRAGKYADHEIVYPAVVKAAEFIARHRNSFESVTVHYSLDGIDESGVGVLKKHNVTFRPVQIRGIEEPRKQALEQMQGFDLVISSNTFAHLAIASGIPTILFGADTLDYHVNSYALYRDHYRFPRALEDMSIQDVLDVRKEEGADVKRWKELNIGRPFDAKRFLEVVKEYV